MMFACPLVADAAGELSRSFFRKHLAVEFKAVNSPVTEADQAIETRLREMIGLCPTGLDREQKNSGSGHQADVQYTGHGGFLVTGQNPASMERMVGGSAGPGV